MKRLLFLIILLLSLAAVTHGQITTQNARRLPDKSGVPSGACISGPPFVDVQFDISTSPPTLYTCKNGTWTITAGGGVDVAGPASSTDKAVARFNGTGGKTIQNSTVTIDDNGSVNIPTGQTYKINNVALAKGDVGLGNVDNTSDVNKPVSTAQAAADALNLKISLNLSDLNNAATARTNLSLNNVTNDAQTKAAIVPNTAPGAGQVLAGNAGGTAYAPVSLSQDCTLASTGVITCTKSNNVSFGTAAFTADALNAHLAGIETFTGAKTFSADVTHSGAAIILSGNISGAGIYGTSGIRIKGTPGTFTDTTSNGTVATAYTDVLGGNTIASSSATTVTNYFTIYSKDPIAGSGITLTNKWAMGADSAKFGTSNQLTISNTGVLTATSPVFITPALGTPASGVGTNITGIPAASILAGSLGAGAYVISTSLQAATIELGAATDTTLSRVSAGLIAVEGITVVDVSTAQGLTNKTLTTPVLTGLPTGTGVATANTVSTLVARDGSGNFAAGTITANLTGNASGTAATVTGAAQTAITSVGTLTGLTVSGTVSHTNASPLSMTNGQVVTVTLTSQTVGAATLTVPNFAGVSDTFAFVTLAQTLSNKTFVAPALGAATATSINGNTFTTGTYTLTGTAAKTLNFTNTLTLSGTDSTTMTFPTTSATILGNLATTSTATPQFARMGLGAAADATATLLTAGPVNFSGSGTLVTDLASIQLGGNIVFSATVARQASTSLNLTDNAVGNAGAWKYISTDAATLYQQANGTHAFYVVASGTAGNTITWTGALTIGNAGTITLSSGVTNAAGTPGSICYNTSTFEMTKNNALTCTVSSRDYKTNITDMALSPFDKLRPVQFAYRDQPLRSRWGFIAEEAGAADRRFADGYDAKGIPRSLDQNAILAATVKEVQQLKARIKELEAAVKQ